MQPAPFLIFIIDSRTWIVKHKNIAILASQILLPAPRADMHRAALLFVGFYGILLAERRCPASAAVMLPPRHHIPCAVRRKSNFCHPPDGLNHLYMKDLKEEIHHGYFEYCYCSARPSGHRYHWHCQNHLDDCPSIFSEYAPRKTLFEKIN